jgi:hypothetical protein
MRYCVTISSFRQIGPVLFVLFATLAALFSAGARPTSTMAQSVAAKGAVYLPFMTKAGGTSPAPQPGGQLPAEIVGTWFTGVIPPTDFYDPSTGQWRDTNGLGQMYVFGAGGSYTYAGFLRIQNGQCRSEVSTYQQGTARAAGGSVTLTPSIAKTRTVIVCGSTSDTTTSGPFDPKTLTWAMGETDGGVEQLLLTDNTSTTSFYRQGMTKRLAGAWRRGEVSSAGFFDPAKQSFAPQAGEGAWYRFNADGTYSFGEFGYGQDENGCALTGWIYQQGTLSVSGSQLTTTPTSGVARVENECYPGQADQKPYVEASRSYAWLFRDRATDPKLVLIPLEMFQEFEFTRE